MVHPATGIGPVAAPRQRGNADRAAKIEREYLRSLIATKLERHEGQKHRLAGAGWTHNQGVTDVADMNGKPERGGAFGPAEEQWGRTEMLVPFRSRPQDRKSVGEGKSVSVRVDLGGRRIIQKKKTRNKT